MMSSRVNFKILLLILVMVKNVSPGIFANVLEFAGNLLENRLQIFYHQLDFFGVSYTLSGNPDEIRFYLIDNKNISEKHELRQDEPETFTKFNPKLPTIFIIHGFVSSSDSSMPTTLKQAFAEAGTACNIILVDWSYLSTPVPINDDWPFAYVQVARDSRPIVSQKLAQFIRFMVNSNYTELEKLHIIGHSMGAYIAGGAGRIISSFPEFHGRKVARITGLDPAGPLFNRFLTDEKLTKGDATFVDIYNTAAGSLGITSFSDGHINFLVNGGTHQPGCEDPKNIFFGEAKYGSCSHNYVTLMYAASISNNLTACKFLAEEPSNFKYPCTVNVVAGYQCPPNARGLYYLETPENVYPGKIAN